MNVLFFNLTSNFRTQSRRCDSVGCLAKSRNKFDESMEGFDEDEDVVLEGSAVHRMLQDAGCIDFEPIIVHRHRNIEQSKPKCKMFEGLCNFYKHAATLNIFDDTRTSYFSGMQIANILRAETLLVDHAEFVQSLLEKNSPSFWSKLGEFSTLIASTAILGVTHLIEEKKMTRIVALVASSAATFEIYQKCNDLRAIGTLKNLVGSQNELHQLYKKGIRIMSQHFALGPNSKQVSKRFSNLEIDRLKYIQPITETLLQSLASLSRIYYQTSLETIKMLPKNLYDDFITHFEDQEFNTNGEIMYHHFRSSYYVYMMAQSDAMQLLAVAYDKHTWLHEGTIPRSRLHRVVCNLWRFIKIHKTNLSRILEKYEKCKPTPVQRTFRGPTSSRWKDLYLNLNLLSRRVATIYDTIGSVLEEIDDRVDSGSTDSAEFVARLEPRTREIHKQLDTAKNLAEFSELLVAMSKRSGESNEDPSFSRSSIVPSTANDRPILRDTDPQIIDEVFEEYITGEYLKSLYDDVDDADETRITKLDKLLAKNFMNELKDALVDKRKSMTEREARALSRNNSKINGKTRENSMSEESSIPRPPPLPPIVIAIPERRLVHDNSENTGSRSPVPLPRINARFSGVKDIARNSTVSRQVDTSVPPPPPPPPRIFEDNEKFFFDPSKLGSSRIPGFVNFEEEFVGEGDNSDEEVASDDDGENCVDPTAIS